MCRDVAHEQDPSGYPAEGCARPYRNSRSRRRDRRHRRGLGCGRPDVPRRPAAARVGRERRRVAGAQLRPLEHPRDDADADQLPDGLEAEGEVALPVQGRERVRRLRLDADRPRTAPSTSRTSTRTSTRSTARPARSSGSTRSTSRASGRTASPSATAASTARPRRTPSRSTRRPGRCSGPAEADPQQQRGHRHDAPALRRHGADQHHPGQHASLLQGQRRRHRLGARRRHRQAEVDVQHGLRRRQAVRQPEGQQRRRPVVSARRRQPGSRLHLGRQSRRRCTARRSSRTARAAPAPTSTPTRSSRSTARPASGSGSGRRSPTTCATTT